MNQKNLTAWRWALLAGAAGMAGVASAGETPVTAENTDATIKMLHEAAFVTPAPESFNAVGEHPNAPHIAACFDAANPPSPEIVAAVEQFMHGGSRYKLASRWSGAQGTPRELSWSFVPDGLSIGSGVGEPTAPSILFARFDTLYASQGGRATWINRFVQVFDRWAELSGLSYVRRTSGGNDWDDGAAWGSSGGATRGDVRICAKNIDGGSGILAYNSFPGSGGGGDMVMDSSESWGSSSSQNRFLRNTIAHEHGHGIGFNHVCPTSGTKLMEPLLATNFDGPRQDDIRAVQRHYGDNMEEDNSPAAANDLGTVAIPSSTTYGVTPAPVAGSSDANSANLSIDADGEQDWFKISVAGPSIVQLTVTPIGSTYVSASQSGNCNQTTPTIDALRVANLALGVYDQLGTTLLHAATGAGTGTPETVSNILISDSDGGATFAHVRIYETASMTSPESQAYRMTVTGVLVPTMSATDDAFTDKVTVTWTNVGEETGYEIYRSTDTTLPGAPTGTVGADVLTWDDTTAVPGTVYNYWVKAAFASGGARMVAGPDQGSAEFTEPSCPADINEDGIVDFADYLEFLTRYDTGDLSVDFNDDGLVDFTDYLEFLSMYDAGC